MWRKIAFILLVFLLSRTAPAQFERTGKLRAGTTCEMVNERILLDLEFIQPQPHDTIADIGTYDGYYPIMYSAFSDSVVFFLNDNVTTGFVAFDSLRRRCEEICQKSFTNLFYFTTGTDSSTNLGLFAFDKIVIRDALHHFEKKEKILDELRTKLKPGGQLILFEPVLPEQHVNESLCKGALYREELLSLMQAHGFVLKRSQEGKNDHWWFAFTFNH